MYCIFDTFVDNTQSDIDKKGVIMLDKEGFRPNVGIILVNRKNQVFWGKRIRTHSWQFPQGGIDRGERPLDAMYRELHEEVGLQPEQVRVLARTRDWLRYEVPNRFVRRDSRGIYKGQKQIWFLLQMLGHDWEVNLRATEKPEFDAWRWNDYWVPLDVVIEFKRGVYKDALSELECFLPSVLGRGGSRRSRYGDQRGKARSARMGSFGFPIRMASVELPPGASMDMQPPAADNTVEYGSERKACLPESDVEPS